MDKYQKEYYIYGELSRVYVRFLNGNQLSTVTDDALPVLYDREYDFKDNTVSVTGAEYHYNCNGSLVSDANKGIANIDYDNNNMPRRIQFTNGNVTEYIYISNGEKLRTIHRTAVSNVTVPIGSTLPLTKANTLSSDSTDYIGDFELGSGLWHKYYFDGGYCRIFSGKTNVGGRSILPPLRNLWVTFHYYTQDHLGNNRTVVNENGTLEQVTHYYPFGGIYGDAGSDPELQRHKYNGKKLDRMHGLDWYDYGARDYDAVVPMWTSVDPLCEKYYHVSPYVYCGNNPIIAIDPNGCDSIYYNQDGKELYHCGEDFTSTTIYAVNTTKTTDELYNDGSYQTNQKGKSCPITQEQYNSTVDKISSGDISDDQMKYVTCFGTTSELSAAKDYVKDNGEGGLSEANNREYSGDFTEDGVENTKTGPYKDPLERQNSTSEGNPDWHSHGSGTHHSKSLQATAQWAQAPSAQDIKTCPSNSKQMVFGMRSNLIYKYNQKGVIAILPFNVIK